MVPPPTTNQSPPTPVARRSMRFRKRGGDLRKDVVQGKEILPARKSRRVQELLTKASKECDGDAVVATSNTGKATRFKEKDSQSDLNSGGMNYDSDENNEEHDLLLRTCFEEGDLNGAILGNNKRKRRDGTVTPTFLGKQRKSKRQREKKRRLELEEKQRRDRVEMIANRNLANRVERYFIESYESLNIIGGDEESGYLEELWLALIELEGKEMQSGKVKQRGKSTTHKSQSLSPIHNGEGFKRKRSEVETVRQDEDFRSMVVDIDDIIQQQDNDHEEDSQLNIGNGLDKVQSSSLIAIMNRKLQGRTARVPISVTVIVRGKFLSSGKRSILNKKDEKVISSSLNKNNCNVTKKVKQSEMKPNRITSSIPVKKKRVRQEKPLSLPQNDNDTQESLTSNTEPITSNDIFMDDLIYNFGLFTESKSILDWKRQAQWSLPSKNLSSGFRHHRLYGKHHQIHLASCIQATQQLNQDHLPKQPSSLEVPRRRHKDSTYARWCNELLHCLSSSGRNMALHEWFYCDIDREWHNEMPFSQQIQKELGIPEDTKLSRHEWKLVRQRLCHNRRESKQRNRFSKRFITSQMNEIDSLRNSVRTTQFWGADSKQLPSSKRDVVAAISVGSTVSAFNKSTRILHRGLVLDRDFFKGCLRYRIQFERKELGWEFCKDIDVAAHGPPSIMLSKKSDFFNRSMTTKNCFPGRLPYGTAYGPLIDYHKEINASTIEILKETLRGKGTSKSAVVDSISCEDLKSESFTQRIERDVLTKLMSLYNDLLSRKTAILDSIEAFSYSLTYVSPIGAHDDVEMLESYEEHYEWLLKSLEETNHSLDVALLHLQTMYGSAYSIRYEDNDEVPSLPGTSVEAYHDSNISPICLKWINTTTDDMMKIGPSLLEDFSVGLGMPNVVHDNAEHKMREDLILHQIKSVANIYFIAELCSYLGNTKLNCGDDVEALLRQTVMNFYTARLTSIKSMDNVLYDTAFAKFMDAVTLLTQELSFL